MFDECFVDTACWVGLLNKDDEIHELADSKYRIMMKSGIHFVTTTAVLNEVANSLSDSRFRAAVVEFYLRLQVSPHVEIVFVDQHLWSAGWQVYKKYFDKSWSLTDCISISVMQERGLMKVLTTDRHFKQAGFIPLL